MASRAMNEPTNEMIYERNHTLNCGYEIKWSYDPRSYERNFSYKTFLLVEISLLMEMLKAVYQGTTISFLGIFTVVM